MRNHYRSTLLSTVALLIAAPSSWSGEIPYGGEGHLLLEPSDLQWKPVASMAKGAQIAVLEGDLQAKGEPFTVRLKLPANYRIEPHTHPEYERVTVLSGTLEFAHGDSFERDELRSLPPGGFAVMPPGVPMFGYTSRETVIQLHGTGPWGIQYLDPKDDPRKSP